MGDGSKAGNGLYLQTQSFGIKECVFIISVLIYKFDLNCNIHMQRNQPTIYISAKSIKYGSKIHNTLFYPIYDVQVILIRDKILTIILTWQTREKSQLKNMNLIENIVELSQ